MIFGDNFLFDILVKNMSSDKVFQEDLRKLLQEGSASYHSYICLQLDEKILSLQLTLFFLSEPVTHTIVV